MDNLSVWDKVWEETKDDEGFWWWVRHETDSVRSRKVISYIEKNLGNIDGLNIIEIGCGSGVYSLVLAKRGAKVTLLDYSQRALFLAHKHFDSLGLLGSFVCADALNLEPSLLAKFDAAISFGTIEHYQYPERLQIGKAHCKLVKAGGVAIISAPNRWFLPYEILKLYLQNRDKWHLGYEGAFTRREFFQLADKLGLENIEIFGSAFIADMFRY